jgi:hypothetical protein
MNDPIQIFLKYHLHFQDEYNNYEYEFLKKKWYMRHSQSLYFISNSLTQKSKYNLFVKKLTSNINFYSIPIWNSYYKIKMFIDLLITPQFFSDIFHQNINDIENKLIPMYLITSTNISEYQKYKAVCITNLLYPLREYIELSTVYFLNVNTNEIQIFHIVNRTEMTNKIRKYCKWIRNVQNFGSIYTLDPPSHSNLYPNMKIICDSPEMNIWKKRYALSISELTLLWKCHPKHRDYCHKNGVISFDDTNCISTLSEMYNETDITLLKEMLELYFSPNQTYLIGDKLPIFNEYTYVLYVDFERANDIIYWIGIGEYNVKEKRYTYKTFVASFLTKHAEKEIMDLFVSYIDSIENKQIIYWYAEPIFWKQSGFSISLNKTEWKDLHDIFKNTPILIKGCFNFKLKCIAEKMYEHDLIEMTLPEHCQNGLESIQLAKKYYENKSQKKYHDYIYEYNYFDCRIMFEMMKCFQMIS